MYSSGFGELGFPVHFPHMMTAGRLLKAIQKQSFSCEYELFIKVNESLKLLLRIAEHFINPDSFSGNCIPIIFL